MEIFTRLYMTRNRVILECDFLEYYLKSMDRLQTVGHIYFVDDRDRAYETGFVEKDIHRI